MKIRLLSPLAAAGIAAALLTGTGATVLTLQPSNHEHPGKAADAPGHATTTTSTTAPTTTTTSTTVAPTTTTTSTTVVAGDDAAKEHPDNFGAMVSEDARDGGVDGQEISKAAHERNEKRRAERAAAREDDDDDDDDDED